MPGPFDPAGLLDAMRARLPSFLGGGPAAALSPDLPTLQTPLAPPANIVPAPVQPEPEAPADTTTISQPSLPPIDSAGLVPPTPTITPAPAGSPLPPARDTTAGALAGVTRPAPQNVADILDAAARSHGLDPALLRAVARQESNFDPRALSPAGAQGLLQLEPATARSLGVTDPYDATQNANAGAAYLKQQLDRYGGDIDKTLAAYNAGPGAVDQYGGVPPFQETKDYVERVKGFYASEKAASIPKAPTDAADAAPGQYVFPLVGYTAENVPITTPFGGKQVVTPGYENVVTRSVEPAVNMGVPAGTEIVSPMDGTVIEARTFDPKNDPGWGNSVLIQDANGTRMRLSHMIAPPGVKVGDTVTKGEHLGAVGQTGNATGPHLNFEMLTPDGHFVDGMKAPWIGFAQYQQAVQQQAAALPTTAPTGQEPVVGGPTDQPTGAVEPQVGLPTDVGNPLPPATEATDREAKAAAPGAPQPTDQNTTTPIAGVPQAGTPSTTLAPDAIRELLRGAGMSDQKIDAMTRVGVYANTQPVSTVFDPTPAQFDSERLAAILQTLANDMSRVTGRPASESALPDLMNALDHKALADVPNPGPVLFEQIWPVVAEAFGLPHADDPPRAHALLAGANAENVSDQYDTLYHGTASDFAKFDPKRLNPNSLKGPGIYLTDNPYVAGTGGERGQAGYAENRSEAQQPAVGVDQLEQAVVTLQQSIDRDQKNLDSLRQFGGTGVGESPTYLALQNNIQRNQGTLIDFQQRIDAALKLPGAQIRPVRVPKSLNLLDLEKPVPVGAVDKIAAQLSDDQEAMLRYNLDAINGTRVGLGGRVLLPHPNFPRPAMTGDALFALLDSIVGDPVQVNAALARAGFDGVSHTGGSNMALTDENGQPIRHKVSVVFPESADKLRNLAGLPEGLNYELNDRVAMQWWAAHNPDTAESLAASLGFKWSPQGVAQPATYSVYGVGAIHTRQLGGHDVSEFMATFGNVPDQQAWNTLVARLDMVGIAAVNDEYDPQTHIGSTVLRAHASDSMIDQVQHDLLQYRLRQPPAMIAPTPPRQPTPYELYPRLFAEQPQPEQQAP